MEPTTDPAKKVKRVYRRITPQTVSRLKSEILVQGNATRAVAALDPQYRAPHQRAYMIMKHDEEVSSDDYLEERIEQIAVTAIDRVDTLVNSTDERTALKASQFVIEQRRGKAVQKTENKNFNLNIQSVLQ